MKLLSIYPSKLGEEKKKFLAGCISEVSSLQISQ